MERPKVLYVCQEIATYLPDSEIGLISRNLPQGIQERGKEIRSFMPRYGCINERRNQLHEVIRLSGLNIIIDDTDHPLIIKVASLQQARMQVYFIDNEDYFQRKQLLVNEDGTEFEDNDERMIFFARGVLETVKKLRWSPSIVHCHGWMSAILPLYLKKTFYEDPIYKKSKVIYSLYNSTFKKPFSSRFVDKVLFNGVNAPDVEVVKDASWLNINKLAINFSDAVIAGSEDLDPELVEYAKSTGKPFLEYHPEETYVDAYSEFYNKLIHQ